MEFDKSKVFTCVNADELKIGDKVILADELPSLRKFVSRVNLEKDENLYLIENLRGVNTECVTRRFQGNDGYCYYLAYLVKEEK